MVALGKASVSICHGPCLLGFKSSSLLTSPWLSILNSPHLRCPPATSHPCVALPVDTPQVFCRSQAYSLQPFKYGNTQLQGRCGASNAPVSSADPPCHESMRKGPSPAYQGPSSTSARLPSLHRSLRRPAASLLKPHTMLAVRGANVTTREGPSESLNTLFPPCRMYQYPCSRLACSASFILKRCQCSEQQCTSQGASSLRRSSPCGDSSEVSVRTRCSYAYAVSSRMVSGGLC